MRRLSYVVVELGKCSGCGKDAGEHSIEGLCGPLGTVPVDAGTPRPCFCGQSRHAFMDLDSPHDSRQFTEPKGVA
jgi:hypothetical protein